MNIVLIGLRGTGKTVIAEQLARLICSDVIDIDRLIEEKGRRSISDIVQNDGWEYFREKEHDIISDILPHVDGKVISTGGGAPAQHNNQQYFAEQNNVVVLLEGDLSVLAKRVEQSHHTEVSRPALTPNDDILSEMKTMWEEREHIYRELADISIDVSDESDDKELDISNKALNIATAVLQYVKTDFDLYATIGIPICKSKSPIIHNTGILHNKLNAFFTLLNITTEKSLTYLKELSQADKSCLGGFSVTHPFKEDIIPLLDEVSDDVRAIGACNTVNIIDGRWYGYNTDFIGVTAAIMKLTGKSKQELKGINVVLLGAGGASKAIAYALNKLHANVVILNRTVSRAEKIAEEFGFSAEKISKFNEQNYDLLINATSVSAPVEVAFIKQGKPVLDINYMNKSKLLIVAEEKGCPTMNGLTMLLYQGEEQFRIWFDKELPLELVAERLEIS